MIQHGSGHRSAEAAGLGCPPGTHPLLDGPGWLGGLDQAALLAPLRTRAGRLPFSGGGAPADWFERAFADWLLSAPGEYDAEAASVLDVTAVGSAGQAWTLCWHEHRPRPGQRELITPMWTSLPAVLAAADAGYTIRWTAVDVSLGIDHLAVAAALNEHTAAILVTHPYGSACDTSTFHLPLDGHGQELLRGIPIIADATAACGADHNYRLIGAPGPATSTVFAFDRGQLFGIGDGAALVTKHYPEELTWLRQLCDDSGFWLDTAPDDVPQRMTSRTALTGLRLLPLLRPTIVELHHRKHLLCRLLEEVPALRWRPQADRDGDTGTDLIGYLPDTTAATRAVTTLRAAGIPAHPLLKPPGHSSTSGWAGAWTDTLLKRGIQPPDTGLRTAQEQLLHTGVRIPLTGLRTDDAITDAADRLRTALT